jgi:uncharacterized delta-60 repeat protein
LIFALAATLVAAAAAAAPLASAGDADDLDPTFGGDGRVTTRFSDADAAFGVTVQPDGKVIAVGYTYSYETGVQRMGVARYNPDGSLDTSFSGDGKVATDFPGSPGEVGLGVAVDSAGRIVVMGADVYLASDETILVARYNPDGSLDPSFSGDGRATFAFEPGVGVFAQGLALDELDRPVIVGDVESDGPAGRDFALLRVTTGGAPDPTFSGDGVAITDFGADLEQAYGVGVDDGKIVSVGRSSDDFAISRHDSTGELDDTFGGDGRVTSDFSRFDLAADIAIRPGGSLVVSGLVTPEDNNDYALAQYEPDGDLDAGFGNGGLSVTDFGHGNEDGAYAVELDDDGNAFVSGATLNDNSERLGLVRYDADGVQQGKLQSYFGGVDQFNASLAVQPDGKPVIAGTVIFEENQGQFFLARYSSVLDDEPPNTVIDAGPSGAGNDPDPAIEFSATGPTSGFECRPRPFEQWAPCTSPHHPGPLADGGYRFTVRAIGTNGEPDPTAALRTFIVDTVPPDTSASGKVKGKKGTVTFTGSDPHPGTPPLSFECSLDGAAAEPCTSPATYPGLANGKHTVRVSATDRAGNAEAEAAKAKLKIGGGG